MAIFHLSLILFFGSILNTNPEIIIVINGNNLHQVGHQPPVKVLEQSPLHLNCNAIDVAVNVVSTEWLFNNNFYTYHHTVELDKVSKQDSGNYTCQLRWRDEGTVSEKVEYRTVIIDVLYHVDKPKIIGPRSALPGEKAQLSCLALSNPPPTYYWKQTHQGYIAARNNTITVTGESYWHCWAKSVLIPSFGQTSTFEVWFAIHFEVHKKARIIAVHDKVFNVVTVGSNLSVRCQVDGIPEPQVWWTRTIRGASTIISNGEYLVIVNLNSSLSGTYQCHAENTVWPANGTSIVTRDSKDIHILVTESEVSNVDVKCFYPPYPNNQCKDDVPVDSNVVNTANSSIATFPETTPFTATEVRTITVTELVLAVLTTVGWLCFISSLVYIRASKASVKKVQETTDVNTSPDSVGSYTSVARIAESHNYMTIDPTPLH